MAFTGLGTGTSGDPYQVTTQVQMLSMTGIENVGKYYLMMNDITLTGTTYNDIITVKTYYRVSAITAEYGVGDPATVATADPSTGKYKIYIGDTQLNIL